MKNTSKFSLLYPEVLEGDASSYHWGSNAIVDLDLDQIALAANMGPQYRETTKAMLLNLSADARVIDYRQQVLADFLAANGVAAGFEELLPVLAQLRESLMTPSTQSFTPGLQETLARLSELNLYVFCVMKLQSMLTAAGAELRAQGLCDLRDWLKEITADETFQSLEKNLPGLLAKFQEVPSITIGVNLDNELRPVEATLLSVNTKHFKGGSLLQQLIGAKSSDKPDQGIAQLHELPFVHVDGQGRTVTTGRRVDPMMVPLFRDLLKVLKTTINPISNALKAYAKINANFLLAIEEEAAYYLGAVKLIHKMQAVGLPMCRPEILPMHERVCEMQGMYNLRLALDAQHETADLRDAIVQNEASFGTDGRIFILTGPNQGGKTVYTQAVGISQVLFQAGLYVPAETARISPVDGIYTHFAIEEKSIQGMGRLSEESQRLGEIFQSVTPYGLVLLNESLSSTSSGESLYLARDIVSALRLFSVRAIFATHLHELAEGVDVINNEVRGDSLVISLVAGVELPEGETEMDVSNRLIPRTYKIKPGPPEGHSYAKGIAARYGVSFEQLVAQWDKRLKSWD